MCYRSQVSILRQRLVEIQQHARCERPGSRILRGNAGGQLSGGVSDDFICVQLAVDEAFSGAGDEREQLLALRRRMLRETQSR